MEEIREQIKEVVAYLLDCERTTDKETIESYTDTIMLGADKYAEAKLNYVDLAGGQRFPTNPEIFKWLSEQGYQTDSGEQEYTMMYELDMPKILGDFVKYIAKY